MISFPKSQKKSGVIIIRCLWSLHWKRDYARRTHL